MCKLAVPLSLSLHEMLCIKMFGFLFFYIPPSHPAATYVMGFLSLLLIQIYSSQVFFLHFCTPGWFFSQLHQRGKALEISSFFGNQQMTALHTPCYEQLCSSRKRKRLELAAESKGGLLNFQKKSTSLMMHLALAAAQPHGY